MDKELNARYCEYSQLMSQHAGRATAAIQARPSIMESLEHETKENLQILEELLCDLRQYNPRTRSARNIVSFKEELSKIVEEKFASKEAAERAKRERQDDKRIVDDKLKELKRNIDQLVNSNHEIEEILKQEDDEQLPLLLRLLRVAKLTEK